MSAGVLQSPTGRGWFSDEADALAYDEELAVSLLATTQGLAFTVARMLADYGIAVDAAGARRTTCAGCGCLCLLDETCPGCRARRAARQELLDELTAERFRLTRRNVDLVVVQRILDGIPTYCNADERREVLRRWKASGRPYDALARTTGWNVVREMKALR